MRGRWICLQISVLVFSGLLNAQWVATNGPFGGPVLSFAIQDSILFAGTNYGVFRSTNNGNSWTKASAGLPNLRVSAFLVSGQVLLAAADYWGVYHSEDNGDTWTGTDMGSFSHKYYVLVATDTTLLAGTDFGVSRSSDGGATWIPFNDGLGQPYYPPPVEALVVCDSFLLAGTNGSGIFRSSNGETWTAINTGSPVVHALALDDTILFAGTDDGIQRSSNCGAEWTSISLGAPVYALEVSGQNLYAATGDSGVFRSSDNGQSWAPVNSGLTDPEIPPVHAIAEKGLYLYLGTDRGVFYSTDGGEMWSDANTGLTNMRIQTLVTNDSSIFAGTDAGFFQSTNAGITWTASNSGLTGRSIQTLVVRGTGLFAGTSDGISRSSNSGESWIPADSGLGRYSISTLVVADTILFAQNGSGIYRSTDDGISWASVGYGSDIAASGTFLFAARDEFGVFRSTDYGVTWSSINNGLKTWTGDNPIPYGNLESAGSIIFTENRWGGVYRSTNGGNHWESVGADFMSWLTDVVESGFMLFAGTGSGVMFSDDKGDTWTPVNTGLPNTAVSALAIQGNNLFAGTNSYGIWRRSVLEMVPPIPGDIDAYRKEAKGNPSEQRSGLLDSNRIRTVFDNMGQLGHWPDLPSAEWPKGSGSSYVKGFGVLVAAQTVAPGNGQLIHPVETFYHQEVDTDPATGEVWGFEPVPGYRHPSSLTPAMSSDSATWPSAWEGKWQGFGGPDSMNATVETYFVMDDAQDAEYARAPYLYYPLISDSARKGLGLRVGARGLQWADPMAEDMLFFHYEIINLSDHNYDSAAAGIILNPGIDVADSITKSARFDGVHNMVYTWSPKGLATSGDDSAGYLGLVFVETPEKDGSDRGPFGLNNCSITSSTDHGLTGVWPKNDEVIWAKMTGGLVDTVLENEELTIVAATGPFELKKWAKRSFSVALVFARDLGELFRKGTVAEEIASLGYHLPGTGTAVGSTGQGLVPEVAALAQNYPNPFNPFTIIKYTVGVTGGEWQVAGGRGHVASVRLVVYDLLGREVAVLVDEKKAPGNYEVTFEASHLASGVYLCRMTAGAFVATKKMILLR